MVKNTTFGSDRPCVAVELRRETEKAWLVDAGTGEEIWIPKSQGELYKNQDGSYDLFAEEWILKKKGLL